MFQDRCLHLSRCQLAHFLQELFFIQCSPINAGDRRVRLVKNSNYSAVQRSFSTCLKYLLVIPFSALVFSKMYMQVNEAGKNNIFVIKLHLRTFFNINSFDYSVSCFNSSLFPQKLPSIIMLPLVATVLLLNLTYFISISSLPMTRSQ